jgi:hypothetical protein
MVLNQARSPMAQSAALAARLGLALSLVATLIAGGQSRPRGRTVSPSPGKLSQPDAAVPFSVPEKLNFRVQWSKYGVNAGALELSALERREFFGRAAWHFRAVAQTVETMKIIYPLDDQFDSYTDTMSLTSLQYEAYLHEQGKQQNNSWRMISDGSAAPPNVTAARVAPGTRDPIGLLYLLRSTDWRRTPEVRTPVFDGRNQYQVVARIEPSSGEATVPAGQFVASKIDLRVFENSQEIAGTHFTLWLAQDAARTPVLIEAELPIGSARVELTGRR